MVQGIKSGQQKEMKKNSFPLTNPIVFEDEGINGSLVLDEPASEHGTDGAVGQRSARFVNQLLHLILQQKTSQPPVEESAERNNITIKPRNTGFKSNRNPPITNTKP